MGKASSMRKSKRELTMGRGRVERERVGGGAKQRVGFNGEVKKSHTGRWGEFNA